MSRYSNKIESVGLRKRLWYHYLAETVMSYNRKHFSELVRHHGGKTAGIDTV